MPLIGGDYYRRLLYFCDVCLFRIDVDSFSDPADGLSATSLEYWDSNAIVSTYPPFSAPNSKSNTRHCLYYTIYLACATVVLTVFR